MRPAGIGYRPGRKPAARWSEHTTGEEGVVQRPDGERRSSAGLHGKSGAPGRKGSRTAGAFAAALLFPAGAFAQAPGEVTSLQSSANGSLSWNALSGAAGYNLCRGGVASLRQGNYGACLTGSVQAPSGGNQTLPWPNDARRTGCGRTPGFGQDLRKGRPEARPRPRSIRRR